MAEIRLLNTVAHILTSDHEDIDEAEIIECILDQYKPGMHAAALLQHVKRTLKI